MGTFGVKRASDESFCPSTVVLPGIFCPFKPTILVTSTLVYLLEYITCTVMIIGAALIR